jgi:hypothetical protein
MKALEERGAGGDLISMSGKAFGWSCARERRMRRRWIALVPMMIVPLLVIAQDAAIRGRIVDPAGNALPGAAVQLFQGNQLLAQTRSAADGRFLLTLHATGTLTLKADATGFRPLSRAIIVQQNNNELIVRINELASTTESILVTADVSQGDIASPDPAMKVFATEDLLDANPGRPGAPISIPGYPIETASSGIKAPQYFAPGVAGDIVSVRVDPTISGHIPHFAR